MRIEDMTEIGNVLYRRAADGTLYPVQRMRPDTAPRGYVPPEAGLLDFLNGTGIAERAGQFNQVLNPVEAIGGSMGASQRMLAPDATGWERVQALGDMLSGVAGVAAPMAGAARAGAPGTTALMEGLLGWSPTRQVAGNAARDVAERLSQPGPVPTMYSNPVPGLLGDVGIEDILRAKYPNVKISISGSPKNGYTLSKIEVPKSERSGGVGTAIMRDLTQMADQQGAVLKLSPSGDFGGSVSRLKDFYKRFGFTPNKGRNADYAISESMYRNPKTVSIPALPAPRNEAEAIAKNILELRATGNVDAVTEGMMNAADPQYMYNYTPLPMDQASRMARAAKFSDALHGTGADISAVDSSYFGSGGADLLGSGFYTTGKPVRADIFVPKEKSPGIEASKVFAEGGNVLPLMVREPKAFDLGEPLGDAANQIADIYRQDPFFKVSEMSSGVKFIEDANGGSVMLDPARQAHWALQDLRKAYGPQDVSNVLSEAGYSGVSGPESLGGRVRVAYNPSDVRSRFARFDPMFAHLRNLSAGVAISPLAYGLLSDQNENGRQQ